MFKKNLKPESLVISESIGIQNSFNYQNLLHFYKVDEKASREYYDAIRAKQKPSSKPTYKRSHKSYTATLGNDFFEVNQNKTAPIDNIGSSWKFHLNIEESDLPNAWDVVFPILMKHNVPTFKITNIIGAAKKLFNELEKGSENKESLQKGYNRITQGAQITIYVPNNREKEFSNIMVEIEHALNVANISPGIADNETDKSVGKFTSYRFWGKHKEINYENSTKVKSYKPDDLKDPFLGLGSKLESKKPLRTIISSKL
jgi:hypothetical protein